MAFPDFQPRHADSQNDLLRKIAGSLSLGLGAHGSDIYSASGAHVGEWGRLVALTATTVSFVLNGVTQTLTLVAGQEVAGQISSVNVTSGTIILYRV